MSSTITLRSLANFCRTHTDLIPITEVGGFTNEPFLSICNSIFSDLLMAPYDWDFNRVEMPFFVTCPSRQDYQFGGAVAFLLGSPAKGAGIALASKSAITVTSGTVTVNTLEPHRFTVGSTVYLSGVTMTTGTTANYNSTFTDDGNSSTWSNGWVMIAVTSTSFSFAAVAGQNNNDVGGAPGITDFGWLTDSTMVDINNTGSPRKIWKLQATSKLQPESDINTPTKICVLKDNGDGTLKIRLTAVPGNAWAVFPVYQAKAPLKTSIDQNISPFPDEYSAVIRQAALYHCYRYLNSPRTDSEYQKLLQATQRTLIANDRGQNNVYICPEDGGLMGGGSSSFWSY